MSNLVPNASKQALLPNAPKQPNLQLHSPTDLLQALTGLVNTFSKNGREQQQPQPHQPQYRPQSSRGKGPANGKGFPRKGVTPNGQKRKEQPIERTDININIQNFDTNNIVTHYTDILIDHDNTDPRYYRHRQHYKRQK